MLTGNGLAAVIDRLGIPWDAVEPRGHDVVKLDPARVDKPARGRVVLVTAMTPTPAGEGKTTVATGLVDGLWRRGVRAIGALREPSLGPLFGRKGGAVGGGRARLVPAERINLHFTGDLHAVGSAHNLLSALLDNHRYHRQAPQLDDGSISWPRVMDHSDRALRHIEVSHGKRRARGDRFDITAASEVMAILCLARDPEDLQRRLARIIVGRTVDGRPFTAADLGADGAMAGLLIDALRPNLVRTLEDNPVLVHGGPFANIAQGTSSLAATELGRRMAEVVVTEAGFAFDLGGFKFFDIKGRAGDLRPDTVVLVVTVRALRHHGGGSLAEVSADAVERGLANVGGHLDAMSRLGLRPPIIAINRFPDDSPDELGRIERFALEQGTRAVRFTAFADGGEGAEKLADAVVARLSRGGSDAEGYTPPYWPDDPLEVKLQRVARGVLGAAGATLDADARADLERLRALGVDRLPICVAKTHLSISDDPRKLGRPGGFTLRITGLRPAAGAGFIVAACGPIMTMPGLPKRPAALDVGIAREADGWTVTGLK